MHVRSICGFAGFLAVLFALVGCDSGPPMAEVKGTVTFEGKPVEEGAIRFEAVDGKSPTAGGTIKDGQYSAKVPVGAMKVAISGSKGTGKKKKLYDTPDSPEMEEKIPLLPPKYADYSKTELTFEVKRGVNEKSWDLKN